MTKFTHREVFEPSAALELGADGCADVAMRHAQSLMDGITLRVDAVTESVIQGMEEIDCTFGIARECGMSVDAVAVLVECRF